MNVTIYPGSLGGSIPAVASKSMAHRLMILAALSSNHTKLECSSTSADIEATRDCLHALQERPDAPVLDCGESGSTLRFLLPVVGALGTKARFKRGGRLPERPLAPFDEQLREHGMTIACDGPDLVVEGRLRGGSFCLPGDVSSQFVSGLLLAAPLLEVPLELKVSLPIQSRPYIDLTIDALGQFGIDVHTQRLGSPTPTHMRFSVGSAPLVGPDLLEVEGDWSNAAFWLAAGSMEDQGLTVSGLNLASSQGDRGILAALASFGARIARKGMAARATRRKPRAATFDVAAIPDLVPPLAAVAATTPGTSVMRNAGRLRLKESDRLATVSQTILDMGGKAEIVHDDLVIEGVSQLRGATVNAFNDHRIAMMAAIMATHAAGPTTIAGAECVSKSYPSFWDHYCQLGGNIA